MSTINSRRRRPSTLAVLVLGCLLFSQPALAQDQDTLSFELEGVEVEAARSLLTPAAAPLGVVILARDESRTALEPATSLDAVLSELPGLWVNDRSNLAVGERISIRGMGWRSAFGVRGVQIVLDGIPLTMPDGQAFADIVDPSMVRRAEVMRGPASLFWGNGSGGVLFLDTEPTPDAPRARFRGMSGGSGIQQFAVSARSNFNRGSIAAYASNNERDGFRDYSQGRFTRAGMHARFLLNSNTQFSLNGNFADQDAENPGSLTQAQFDANPRMANARNVSTLAAKRSTQFQLGASLLHQLPFASLTATVFGINRDLDNPLSFTYIDLNRNAGGVRVALNNETGGIRWGIGFDTGAQVDERKNLNNASGRAGTIRSVDQEERVRNLAGYAFGQIDLSPALELTAGLRADQVRFKLDDQLLDDGDQSGERNFSSIDPALGLAFRMPMGTLYANYRSAFETPTTTEIVNSPDGNAGFNPTVEPQKVQGIELGMRGFQGDVSFDVALYSMQVSDLLLPFQTEAGGDRTFYRNGGKTKHLGAEAFAKWRATSILSLQLMYSYGNFTFDGHEQHDGNHLPGIPDHRFHIAAEINDDGWWMRTTLESASSMFVNDANSAKTEAYQVLNVTIGNTAVDIGPVRLQPFLEVFNVTDRVYSGSVIVNAFGGRFFEPAPGRTVSVGVNVAL